MKERPILFSSSMVLALLAGTKTQTRRMLKVQTPGRPIGWGAKEEVLPLARLRCPYGEPGDRLWVRETLKRAPSRQWKYAADSEDVVLPESDPRVASMISWAHHKEGSTCVSIHMPRWASRLSLEVTGVRVERLQDISEEDAKAEGVRPFFETFTSIGRDQRITSGELARDGEYRAGYACLWDEINEDRATWKSNPWVWVVEFRRLP